MPTTPPAAVRQTQSRFRTPPPKPSPRPARDAQPSQDAAPRPHGQKRQHRTSTPSLPGDPLAGSPYKSIQLIGAGGMGQVLLAAERSTGRRVAVKLIRRRFGHMPDLVARFHEEARAASQTGHPHIVEVLDFGETPDGRPFMVMELLHGESLHDLMRRKGRLPQEMAMSIALQICDALGAAHVRGVIHRDLKPANVFLSREGRKRHVKILDFGLAKLTGYDDTPEVPRKVYGTPEYMAPEMARPAAPPQATADIYSLGVLLYEMLTGEVPFSSEDPSDVVESHLTSMPTPPTEKLPQAHISKEVESIVMVALRKRPERRYPSMEEMSRSLWRVQRRLHQR